MRMFHSSHGNFDVELKEPPMQSLFDIGLDKQPNHSTNSENC